MKKHQQQDSRPKRDTRNPCEICGWSAHMAIHQPATKGTREVEYWGHRYQPRESKESSQ